MKGVVDSWSASAGVGTILGQDGQNYAFEKSDVIEAEPTLPGAEVSFTASLETNQPQATAIKVLRDVVLTSTTDAAGGVVVTDIRLPFFSVVRLVFQVAAVSFLLWLVGVSVIVSLRMF
ncbi:MAG: hypothetical protein NW204_00190 [Xanthomonadaceae bacterium]|nr:hypothetical protein [Xanthomonadaceae bacterium]